MSKVAVIGVGNMGYAYVRSIVNKNIAQRGDLNLFDVSVGRVNSLKEEGFTNSFSTFNDQISQSDIIVLAVKPQFFAEVAQQVKPFIKENQVLVSIMAGVKSSLIAKHLGNKNVVRAMPNTPCLLNKGITGFHLSEEVAANASISKVKEILESTGVAVEVKEEDLIDAVTAVSGSGPAYFYYFVQQMVAQGVALGLPEDVATKLANTTMAGAHAMIDVKGGKSIQDLIDAVTSKGGTTLAALTTMQDNGVGENIQKAVKAANDRAAVLSEMIENA